VPLLRMPLVRYGGCLAPHSHRRRVLTPTPRQHGVGENETDPGAPRWRGPRRLKRILAVDMARCLFCQQGALWMIAAITQGEVMRKMLCYLRRAADLPSHGSGACPSRSLGVAFRLTAPGGSQSRPPSLRRVGTKHLSSGPPPDISPHPAGK
jgi:hypothetical protein